MGIKVAARRPLPYEILLRELRVLAARKGFTPPRIRKPSKGKGLTARQMMRFTPQRIRENAEYVKVRRIRKRKSEPFSLGITVTDRRHATEEQPHYMTIEVLSPKGERNNMDQHTRIKCSCDCSNFKFMWEYALWKQGSADIIYSNGEPARETNSRNIPGTCKHLYRVFHFLKERSPKS